MPVQAEQHPVAGLFLAGNWEGTGVTPDVEVPGEQARDRAYRLALEHVAALPGAIAGNGVKLSRTWPARAAEWRRWLSGGGGRDG